MRVLLVEDDRSLGEGICTALKPEGYTVDWVTDGRHGLEALCADAFDVVVLDLGLPRMDGLQVLRRIRERGVGTPVIILTARDATADRIEGLDAGADDYLVKPFDLAELKARLRALLRRSFGRSHTVLALHGVELDPVARTAVYRDRPVPLSRREFVLLHELLAQAGRVLTRDKIQQVLYGWREEVESNTVEVHIHHLRRKFFPELIRTVRGIGYTVDRPS